MEAPSPVLSAMNTTINRINSITEPELAIRLYLVADNDELIFLNGSTDPYSNNNTSAMLGENQSTINSIIGSSNYDIGHVFSTGGGGVAYLASVCTSFKAGGVSGLPAPIGDPLMWIMWATRWATSSAAIIPSTTPAAATAPPTDAYEPGSGSTIMSYSGICAPNLQNLSDDVYHVHSQIEASDYLHSGFGNNCATQVSSGNSAPSVTVGASAFFDSRLDPLRTLCDGRRQSGTVPDLQLGTIQPRSGHRLRRQQPQQPLGQCALHPLLCSRELPHPGGAQGRKPRRQPDLLWRAPPGLRPHPHLQVHRAGQQSGVWRCRGRYQDLLCGRDDRPFLVSYPNNNHYPTGQLRPHHPLGCGRHGRWNVNCANVDIFCSVDGGYTWPYLLAEAVPNDGSHVVVLPPVTTTQARIKVRGDNTIFFDISNSNFTLNAVQGCTDPNACNYMEIASVDDGSCVDPLTLYADADGDGYGNSSVTATGCENDLIGYVTNATDCDDTRNDVYPGAPGTQDGVDNDCSGGPLDPEEEAQCPEDLDNDGLVNVNDILLLLGEFGCTTDCTFDLNGVPGVDVADFLLLLGAYGLPCSN